jgi:CRISPR-associated endoribonuclease Cas6
MPRQWTLELAAEPERPMGWRFDVLHAIACSVFEQPDGRHDSNEKAFAVRTGLHSTRTIVLTWLDDLNVPVAGPPELILVGDEKIPLAGIQETAYGYDEIEAGPITTELGFTVSTPALFKHHGHNYPLPDPYITFASLARRYRTYRPETGPDDDLIRELGRTIMIVRHRIKTERFSWHGRTDSGFTGEVEFTLGAGAGRQAREAFGRLGTFAGIAGIGRGTTHGLGATTVRTRPAAAGRSRQGSSRR